ncbi:hypothetical protein EA860_19695, partial [Vibrio anguillarum]|nr:hypothetical protein [Vibrio anguillarum]
MMVVITALIAKFMMFAVEIFPKSFVSSASFGYFSYNVTLITLLASLISFGGVNYLLKDLPSARNEFSSFLTTIYISFIIFLILLITPNLSYVVSFSAFGISLIMTTSVYFRFKSKTKSWYLFKDIFKSLFFVLLIIFLGNESISGSELSQLYLYSILISLVLTLFTVMVNYTRQFTLYISLETIKNRAIHSAPIVFTGLTYILVSRVDTFYIKDAFGYESLSDYNFVSRVMYQSLFFMQLFQARKLHKVAALFSKREDELAIKLASEIRRNSTLATIFLASMIALFINTDLVRSYFNISEGFVFE